MVNYLLDGVLNGERLLGLFAITAAAAAITTAAAAASELTAQPTLIPTFLEVAIAGRVSVADGDPQKKAQSLGKLR